MQSSPRSRRAPAEAVALPRCALCRLDERRRRQATMRRVWIGLYAGGFVFFAGLALRHNLVQGIALIALAIVLMVLAFVYDRALRRR